MTPNTVTDPEAIYAYDADEETHVVCFGSDTLIARHDIADHSVWIVSPEGKMEAPSYYRGVLPARMTSGSVVSESPVAYSPSTRVIRGFGPVTIFHLGSISPACEHLIPHVLDVLRADECRVYIDVEDDPRPRDWRHEHLATVLGAGTAFDDPATIATTVARMQQEVEDQTRLQRIVSAVDGVIVTTQVLADLFARVARSVHVMPNVIDPEDDPLVQRQSSDGVIRIGYAGYSQHLLDDLPIALPALLECARRPGVELHFWGCHPLMLNSLDAPGPGRYIIDGVPYCYHSTIPRLEDYHRSIGRLDIAVAPLADNPWNRARSSVKWIEHSMHGTAMVVSDLDPYACVEDGVTGLKARTPADFSRELQRLVEDTALRQRIGNAARDEVLTHHSTMAAAGRWQRLIYDACGP